MTGGTMAAEPNHVRILLAKQIKDPARRIVALQSARSAARTSAKAPPPSPTQAPKKIVFLSVRPSALPLGQSADGNPYRLNLSAQPNSFVSVVGASGTGKTEFLRSLAARLHHEGIAVLLFDLHGDLKISGAQSVAINEKFGFDPVAVLLQLSEPARRAVFRQILPSIGYVQEQQLAAALETAKTLPKLLSELGKIGTASANGLRAAFERTFSDPAFLATGFDAENFGARSLRFDLSGLSRSAQPVAASLALLLLFERLRKAGPTTKEKQLRSFVFLDEASVLRSEHVIDVLTREARKFGLGLAVASQTLRDLSDEVLANASVSVVFRLLNRSEATRVEKLIPGMSAGELLTLRAPGEALIRDSAGVHRVTLQRAPSWRQSK